MIAIAFALEFESVHFRARHDNRLRVATWLLGAMGEEAARILDKRLAETKPALVISAGFAGGLQPELEVGSLVLGKNYSVPSLLEKLKLSPAWRVGDICTESAIIEQAADKIRLGQETGGLAGDLETSHIARVCAERAVPMLSVRCISDALHDDMPVPADILLNPKTYRPEPLLLFRYLLTNPKSVVPFNRLLKNAKTAQAQLAQGLEEILPQLLTLV
ncbi:hypothetical protein BH09VER1_BH09VER1_20670 [soil metagenome]